MGRVNSHIEVRVSDTGIGIDQQFLPYVFDRFRQADSSMTRTHSGLGLGLAIVRHLVELHGGTVMAESAGEGQGAVFTVQLPRMVPAAALSWSDGEDAMAESNLIDGAGGAPVSTPNLTGLRVLVVDDEPDTLEVITMALHLYGASVRSAESSVEAMKAFPRMEA